MKLFLVKTSVPHSTYSAVAASFFVEAVYDATIGIPVLLFAFTQGVFPKPPDFASLDAFDLSFFAGHLRFTLFLLTALAIGGVAGLSLPTPRTPPFLGGGRPGLPILF